MLTAEQKVLFCFFKKLSPLLNIIIFICDKIAAPKWSSVNLGIYICFQCSGEHRHIGTQYSFVKSCTMDKWSREQIDIMLAMGNEAANDFWESKLPSDYNRPNDEGARRNFIKNKYVRRIWAPSDGPVPYVYA